jgi:hypothetical protein
LRKENRKKIGKKNVWVLRRPDDEAISLFTGLLPNPDVPLSLGELEHLKIKTRLINEMFASVIGEYVFLK